jgi:hypothetical protein
MKSENEHDGAVMPVGAREPVEPYEDLLGHLEGTFGLRRPQANRLVREVLAYFNEPLEAYVKRRHGELQRQGLANPAIFERIAVELRWWRLAAPPLTERQIRRIIYG